MTDSVNQLQEIALRIREMRLIMGMSMAQMAEKTGLDETLYESYESGQVDLPFSFIHKCALAFGIEITDLLEGHSAHLSNYTVTRRGKGVVTAQEKGIRIQNLAPMFHGKIAEPYWVRYDYSREQQFKPIHLATHSGQEFDLVLSGTLKVQIGDHIELLNDGDSIYYNSSTPHGMIAVDGHDCLFLAVVLPGEETEEKKIRQNLVSAGQMEKLICEKFIHTVENEQGQLQEITFENEDSFNFAFDVVDAVADRYPDRLALLHLDVLGQERRFTFKDMKRASAQCANYFLSMGITKGDRVMLVLKRHWQFWPAILALHKLGAIAIPATNQLQAHDFAYRFEAADVKAILCTADGNTAGQVESALEESGRELLKIIVGGERGGWRNFDRESALFSHAFQRSSTSPCGDDPMLMFFTSGTTGYPKIAVHSYKYPLGHYITGRYWHTVRRDGLHFTISDTGWGKALWGKLYGQWMCEGAVFAYDFDRFDAKAILPLFAKYHITTFCAPPTMYRMLLRQNMADYDLSSLEQLTTAGEAMNPDVARRIEEITGLCVMEGFGQTETTLSIANLVGSVRKPGSMGKPVPLYDICLLDREGNPVSPGTTGEICIRTDKKKPCGLFLGYWHDAARTDDVWHDGWYHTGDVAWMDEDGYYWYVGRADDVIKSSGYRIGPFEIESVIMELPYVVECGVSPAPDEVRGQVVKASIVLSKDKQPSEELKKEIQDYVKSRTAPYKYPRIVVFRDELPKTSNGKIQRNLL